MRKIKLTLPDDSGRYICEAFKSVRTNILFCGQGIKIIGFTSHSRNEGKTTVSLCTAKSFADLGEKVLFIDANMRELFFTGQNNNVKISPGLSELLSKTASLSDCLCATQYSGLDILFSGAFPSNPTELLSGKSFESILNELKNMYDRIFIDTPPLGFVIDASVVSNYCDGMIFVLGDSKIHYTYLKKTVGQLKRSRCPILGVVRSNSRAKAHRI